MSLTYASELGATLGFEKRGQGATAIARAIAEANARRARAGLSTPSRGRMGAPPAFTPAPAGPGMLTGLQGVGPVPSIRSTPVPGAMPSPGINTPSVTPAQRGPIQTASPSPARVPAVGGVQQPAPAPTGQLPVSQEAWAQQRQAAGEVAPTPAGSSTVAGRTYGAPFFTPGAGGAQHATLIPGLQETGIRYIDPRTGQHMQAFRSGGPGGDLTYIPMTEVQRRRDILAQQQPTIPQVTARDWTPEQMGQFRGFAAAQRGRSEAEQQREMAERQAVLHMLARPGVAWDVGRPEQLASAYASGLGTQLATPGVPYTEIGPTGRPGRPDVLEALWG